MNQLTLIAPEPELEESADERLAGLHYNALYMLSWQIGRANAGVWDAYTLPLLERGLSTALHILANGQTFGRYGRPQIETLCADAQTVIADYRARMADEREAA